MASLGLLEVANFICRFGESAVMLDHFVDIVFPAFRPSAFHRTTKSAKYFVSECRIETFVHGANTRSALIGRFVKDVELRRTQLFEPEVGLVADAQSMRSSPSSIFVITLEDHKLFLYAETPFAPSLSEFKTSAKVFLRSSYSEFFRARVAEMAAASELSESEARIKLSQQVPRPSLEVVELLNKKSIAELMRLFRTVKSLDIEFHLTNNELSNRGFFNAIRDQGEKSNSAKTTLKQSNSEGLAKEEVEKQVRDASDGNATVKIVGFDGKGDTLKGNTEKLKITRHIEQLPKLLKHAASRILENFWDMAENEEIVTAKVEEIAIEKTASILKVIKALDE